MMPTPQMMPMYYFPPPQGGPQMMMPGFGYYNQQPAFYPYPGMMPGMMNQRQPIAMSSPASFVGVSPPTIIPDPESETSRLIQREERPAPAPEQKEKTTQPGLDNQQTSSPASSASQATPPPVHLRKGHAFHEVHKPAATTTTTTPPPNDFEVTLRQAMERANRAFDLQKLDSVNAKLGPAFHNKPREVQKPWKMPGFPVRSVDKAPSWKQLLGVSEVDEEFGN